MQPYRFPFGVRGPVELVVRDQTTGAEFLKIILPIPGDSATVGPMAPSPFVSGAMSQDAQADHPNPVAGRIESSPSTMLSLVEEWQIALERQRKSKQTRTTYRAAVERALVSSSWTSPTDLQYDAVAGYIERQRTELRWRSSTATVAVSALRSFSKFLMRKKLLGSDPTELIETGGDDERGQGSRAATTEEGRAMLLDAIASDHRPKHQGQASAVVLAMSFLAGLREDEHRRLCWRHLHLDTDEPAIEWTGDINKNRRHEWRALHPILAELLRAHREKMRALVGEIGPEKRRGVKGGKVLIRPFDPANPAAFVFPTTATRAAFTDRRDKLGIAAADSRGRSLTSHSARKWFSTQLATAGVGDDVRDFLMRHAGKTELKYLDLDWKTQIDALTKLPGVWPLTTNSQISDSRALTKQGSFTDDVVPHSRGTAEPPQRQSSSGPAQNESALLRGCGNSRGVSARRGPVPMNSDPRGVATASIEAAIKSATSPRSQSHFSGLKERNLIAVADLLEALAALLRSPEAVDDREHPASTRTSRTPIG